MRSLGEGRRSASGITQSQTRQMSEEIQDEKIKYNLILIIAEHFVFSGLSDLMLMAPMISPSGDEC